MYLIVVKNNKMKLEVTQIRHYLYYTRYLHGFLLFHFRLKQGLVLVECIQQKLTLLLLGEIRRIALHFEPVKNSQIIKRIMMLIRLKAYIIHHGRVTCISLLIFLVYMIIWLYRNPEWKRRIAFRIIFFLLWYWVQRW